MSALQQLRGQLVLWEAANLLDLAMQQTTMRHES